MKIQVPLKTGKFIDQRENFCGCHLKKKTEADIKWILGKSFCGGSEIGSLSAPEAGIFFFVSILKHLSSINTKGVEKHNLKISRRL